MQYLAMIIAFIISFEVLAVVYTYLWWEEAANKKRKFEDRLKRLEQKLS